MQKLFENWRKHLNENEPLHGFPHEPMPEEDAMRDLADKFGVKVEFTATKKGEPIAIVTFEDGEQTVYRDEEEMYQDLAKRYEMNEENKKVDEGADDFDSEGNLIEQNLEAPLNEAIFGGVGMLLLGKLFVFLFKALQSKDELKKLDNTLQQSNAPDAAKEISAKTLELLGTVERNAPALEKAAQATGLGGNLNPLNWKTNALIALSSGAIKKMYGKEDDDISLPEPEVSENNKGIE